ncbi:glycerate kinase [Rarobacter faecitabidus]|uniref:Glycerate kinase n=1 Tax=Rarobacter faecitabidus TaxID=13243 RepID=A0A542ZDV7_RARFA|nr:glycerate kinase [Rarobacter faecitabidus]TQL58497.1 glycerate kinase [Rarobacter faecitabidus]
MAIPSLRVVIAPDSFKGTIGARAAAEAIAAGWRLVRPGDDLQILPQADGGEGSLDALAAAVDGARLIGEARSALDGPGVGQWLELPDGVAVVELAACCGLGLYPRPAPLTASTAPLGQTIAAALDSGARRVVVALGGSASTDGGVGALSALGARFVDEASVPIPSGGAGLRSLASIDVTGLRPVPAGGVLLLTDVRNPLLGSRGAANVFAPQKGASSREVRELEDGMTRLATVVRAAAVAADDVAVRPGSGAAGGAGFGLMALWGARSVPGAGQIAALTGLRDILANHDANLVITGEGRVDPTSFEGKVVGTTVELTREAATPGSGCHVAIIAGQIDRRALAAPSANVSTGGIEVLSLTELSGSADSAMSDARHWLAVAGRRLAERYGKPKRPSDQR